jgi:predicted O-linked N-acetylglucosamine transferase (SPINDLY family)
MIEAGFLDFIGANSSRKNSSLLAKTFIDFLKSYHAIKNIDFHKTYPLFNQCISQFLECFASDNFIIPDEHFITFIYLNKFISELVAISPLKNTDSFINRILTNQVKINFKSNFVKILALFSPRNRIIINYKDLASINPQLFSLWYWSYLSQIAYINERDYNNVQNHLDHIELINQNSLLSISISIPYFYCTYANPVKDRQVKEKINFLVKGIFQDNKITNFPEKNNSPKGAKNKIAVITGLLSPAHPVHRSLMPYIKSLIPDYELTLVHLGKMKESTDTGIFTEVINFEATNYENDLLLLKNNNFSLAFYPDIGMTLESVFLSNIRLAPVQVTALGHSVSTFGSEIDYFISGIESEIIEKASENYSERLVLIPGIGLYTDQYYQDDLKLISQAHSDPDKFIIACPWGFQKINYDNLIILKKILSSSEKKITYLFLPALNPDSYFLAIEEEIKNILGADNIEVIPDYLTHRQFMNKLETADIIIDSFPFGGYNTIIDSLYLNKALVTLEGTKAYNRFSGAMLRRLGLDELITNNSEEFIEKVLKLVNNDNYRHIINEKIRKLNPGKDLFNQQEIKYFKQAIDYLIENHQKLQADKLKDPVIIS